MSTLFEANFTAADGTLVSAISQSPYANFTQFSGTGCAITSNRARRKATFSEDNHRTNISGGFSTADYSVEARIYRLAASSSEIWRFFARGTAVANCYRLTWFNGTLTLARVVSGWATTIGTPYTMAFAVNTDRLVRLVLNGTALEVFVDDVSVITGTDSTYTAADQAGFSISASNSDDPTTTGFQFETFIVKDLVPPTALVVDTQPANAWTGEAIPGPITIRATTDGTTTDTAFTGNIVIAKETGTGNDGGTLTVAATAGISAFPTATITGEGVHSWRATATGYADVVTATHKIATGTGVPGGGDLTYTEADMQYDTRARSAASQTGEVLILNTDGTPATGLAFNTSGFACHATTDAGGTPAAVTLVTMTLGTYAGGASNMGFVQINATTRPGWYAIGYPTFPGSGNRRVFTFTGTGLRPATVIVDLTGSDARAAAETPEAIANEVTRQSIAALRTAQRTGTNGNGGFRIVGPDGEVTTTIATNDNALPLTDFDTGS